MACTQAADYEQRREAILTQAARVFAKAGFKGTSIADLAVACATSVLASVRRTRRCLIVHEDLQTAGFGAEIAAVVADEASMDLDAPVSRLTMPDIPSPHNAVLLDWAVPSVARIRAKIDELIGF